MRLERRVGRAAHAALLAALRQIQPGVAGWPGHHHLHPLAPGRAPGCLLPGRQSAGDRPGDCLELRGERGVDLGRCAMNAILLAAGHAVMTCLLAGAVALSLLLTMQSVYTLYIMLYTWDRPEAPRIEKAPTRFLPPRRSFTVLLPARHDEDVIQTTIDAVVR